MNIIIFLFLLYIFDFIIFLFIFILMVMILYMLLILVAMNIRNKLVRLLVSSDIIISFLNYGFNLIILCLFLPYLLDLLKQLWIFSWVLFALFYKYFYVYQFGCWLLACWWISWNYKQSYDIGSIINIWFRTSRGNYAEIDK